MFTHGKICLALTALQKYKQSLIWNDISPILKA